jgi:polyisoprenoid-binding protein YceI
MQTIRRTALALVTLSATVLAALPAAAADWNLDASHSHVGFKVRHMAISKVKGSFGDFAATVQGEPGKPGTFSVEATVQLASIDTANEKRDDHLRSADFFDVAQHPTMTFRSTGVTMDGDEGRLAGELTIRGVTKPVTFDLEYAGQVTDPWGNVRMGFAAEATIDRREFGLTWSKALETGGLVVDNEVEIELEIELVQAK